MTTLVSNPSGRKSTKDKKTIPNKNVPSTTIISNNVTETINSQTEEFRSKNDKFQPTAEQMRIASLMSDKKDENDLKPKIDQIVELTGASRDDAAVALYDCDNDMAKAVEMILDGDSLDSEWQSTGKKKKTKQQEKIPLTTETLTNGNKKADKPMRTHLKNNSGSNSNTQGNATKGPRGGSSNSANKVPRKKEARPNESKIESTEENDIFAKAAPVAPDSARRGARRGGPGGTRGSRGAPRGAKAGPAAGRVAGSRIFTNSRGMPSDGFPNSIETWTNSTAEQANKNDDLNTMKVGNWSDIAGNNEDWSEEDWTAPMETKVFTPSTKTIPEKDETIDQNKSINHNNSQLPFIQPNKNEENAPPTMSAILSGNLKRQSANAGQALLQQIQQSSAPQNSNLNQYSLSQYSKQATESIKSLVGLSSNNIISNDLIPSNEHSLDNNLPQVSKTQTQVPNQHNRRPNVPNSQRASKIPESAVEMPSSDPISNLSVHFGSLEFGSNSFSIGSNDTTNLFDTVGANTNVKPDGKNISLLSSNTDSNNSSNANFRSANTNANQANKSMLQGTVLPHQSLNDTILSGDHRNDKSLNANSYSASKQQMDRKNDYISNVAYKASYGTNNENAYSSAYPASLPSNLYYSNTNQMTAFGNAGPGSQSLMANHGYNSTYNASVNMANSQNVSKIRDIDNNVQQQVSVSSVSSTSKPYDASTTVGSSLSLMSNSTVTTNVLKNTLSASKGVHNVPPGVQPAQVLSAPYILGNTAGMPMYPYATYDGQFPTMPRDHGYPYPAAEVKYSRGSESDMLPVSSQAAGAVQTATQAHNQPYPVNTYPPGYGFYFGVNFAHQGLYNQHMYPVPQAQTSASAGTAFAKANTAASYGSHSYNSGYDSLGANVQSQDYVNKTYQQPLQQHKQMSGTNSGDLAGNNTQSMYGKSHSQINKSYDKQTFQQSTPFNMSNSAQPANLSSGYGAPYQMLPQQTMHHSLTSAEQTQQPPGVNNQRSLPQTHKSSASNNSSYSKFGWN
ncbi:hypothetical protein RDWZM_004962 [Blomia tropicalis]|uniref:Ubiquitin-associated protein 2 n=1 Tax=Blomia tropicalis TaxID=40697 RepID=A0A9Q0M4V4_BLOTA|nr:hypothetical protein RDWZM_004962 [Blomia tropicalis]